MDAHTFDITGLPDSDALEKAGLLIDEACDKRSSHDVERAFDLLSAFEARNPSPEFLALMHYFRANAWACRYFETRTLRLLKLTRAALMYLSLSVASEERRRHHSTCKLAMPMPLDVWDDEWKR